jgi:hypothetical protein
VAGVTVLLIGGFLAKLYFQPRSTYYRILQRMEPWIRHCGPAGNTKEQRTIIEIKKALYTAASNERFTREINGRRVYMNRELAALADYLDRSQGVDMKTAAGAWHVVDLCDAIAPDLHEYVWMVDLKQMADEGIIMPRPPPRRPAAAAR